MWQPATERLQVKGVRGESWGLGRRWLSCDCKDLCRIEKEGGVTINLAVLPACLGPGRFRLQLSSFSSRIPAWAGGNLDSRCVPSLKRGGKQMTCRSWVGALCLLLDSEVGLRLEQMFTNFSDPSFHLLAEARFENAVVFPVAKGTTWGGGDPAD